MNAAWLDGEFSRGGPEWKLVIRWTHFVARKKQGITSSERHTWNKGVVNVSVKFMAQAIKKGEIVLLPEAFGRGMSTWELLRAWWPEFMQTEKELIAELVLTR